MGRFMDKLDLLSDDLKDLYNKLNLLNEGLSDFTYAKYKRVNPFVENLIDWHKKSEKYAGDKSITIYDSATLIGEVEVGSHSWIGPFCMLDGSGGLRIGEFCSISSGVMIYSHDTVKWSLSGGRAEYEYASTSVGDNCFIGTQTIVVKGVHIGASCLVGANSLVNRDLPDRSIAAGVPAKIIGEVVITDNTVELKYFEKGEKEEK